MRMQVQRHLKGTHWVHLADSEGLVLIYTGKKHLLFCTENGIDSDLFEAGQQLTRNFNIDYSATCFLG